MIDYPYQNLLDYPFFDFTLTNIGLTILTKICLTIHSLILPLLILDWQTLTILKKICLTIHSLILSLLILDWLYFLRFDWSYPHLHFINDPFYHSKYFLVHSGLKAQLSVFLVLYLIIIRSGGETRTWDTTCAGTFNSFY